MQDEPTPNELIKAVADFLRNEIAPVIKGHNAFKLRVGINALDLVTRQLALEQAMAEQRDYPAVKAMVASQDYIEGPKAFSEKRPPKWVGK